MVFYFLFNPRCKIEVFTFLRALYTSLLTKSIPSDNHFLWNHSPSPHSAPGAWRFLQEAVGFLVDGSAWTYSNDLNDSFGRNFVDDSEAVDLKTLEPSEFGLDRFTCTGFRRDQIQGRFHLSFDFGME